MRTELGTPSVRRKAKAEGPVVIKKYANRRLYNTQTSSYVTLDHLAAMVKEGTEFEVQDARTGEDITRCVLTQIIFEEEAKGQSLLPIKFLRQLIRFYGDSLQAFVPGYLDMSMESFTKNQGAMRDRIAEALGGGNQMIENLTRQNLQLFENAMAMFTPFGAGAAKGEARGKAKPAAPVRGSRRSQGRDGSDAQAARRAEPAQVTAPLAGALHSGYRFGACRLRRAHERARGARHRPHAGWTNTAGARCGALAWSNTQKIKKRWLVDFDGQQQKFTVIVEDDGNHRPVDALGQGRGQPAQPASEFSLSIPLGIDNRLAEVEALEIIDAEILQQGGVVVRAHPFRHRLDVEVACARPTRVRTKTWFSGDWLRSLHIGAVDLDGIDMQHLQIAE